MGLGHSDVSTSVMYATLSSGVTSRAVTAEDLHVPDDGAGPSALRVAPVRPVAAHADAALAFEYGGSTIPYSNDGFWAGPGQRIDQASGSTRVWRTEWSFEPFGDDALAGALPPAIPSAERNTARIDPKTVAYDPHLQRAAAIDAVFGLQEDEFALRLRADERGLKDCLKSTAGRGQFNR